MQMKCMATSLAFLAAIMALCQCKHGVMGSSLMMGINTTIEISTFVLRRKKMKVLL